MWPFWNLGNYGFANPYIQYNMYPNYLYSQCQPIVYRDGIGNGMVDPSWNTIYRDGIGNGMVDPRQHKIYCDGFGNGMIA